MRFCLLPVDPWGLLLQDLFVTCRLIRFVTVRFFCYLLILELCYFKICLWLLTLEVCNCMICLLPWWPLRFFTVRIVFYLLTLRFLGFIFYLLTLEVCNFKICLSLLTLEDCHCEICLLPVDSWGLLLQDLFVIHKVCYCKICLLPVDPWCLSWVSSSILAHLQLAFLVQFWKFSNDQLSFK